MVIAYASDRWAELCWS